MRKTFFALFALFAISSLTQAQVVNSFGLRGGLSLSKYSVSADGVSINFGTDAKIYVRGFYLTPVSYGGGIQLEAGYSGRGFTLDDDLFGFGGPSDASINLNYLDFGAFYRQQFGEGPVSFFVLGGPLLSYALSGNGESMGMKEDIDFDNDEFKRIDFSLELGGGLLFGPQKNIALEIRYSNGFVDLAEDLDNNANFTHSAFSFGLGVSF